MTFKFKKPGTYERINLPTWPRHSDLEAPEQLMGSVNGLQASAPEERLAKALDKAGINYVFRYTVGAPRGLPGWKELDFLIQHTGLIYAVEVDTAFTHRKKANADVLHDAIIQNDKQIQAMGTLWPTTLHADGDSELATFVNAQGYVARTFGKG